MKIIKQLPEIIGLPIAVIGWLAAIKYLPLIFPAMGIIDEGIVQVPIIAALFLLFNNFIVFVGIKFNFPSLWKKYDLSLQQSSSLPLGFYKVYIVLHITLAILELAVAS